MSIHWLWVYGVELVAILCCAWAFMRGGPVERYGAAMILFAWEITVVVDTHDGTGPGMGVVVVDVLLFIGLLALATWSRRIWTMFAAAFQLNCVAAHFAEPFIRFDFYSYVTAYDIWGGVALVVALAGGMISFEMSGKAKENRTGTRWPYYLLLLISLAFVVARVTHNVPFKTPYMFPSRSVATQASLINSNRVSPKPQKLAVVCDTVNSTAQCADGVCSFSKSHVGTCSRHGGVATWFK